jgi:hypothetical protein
MGYMEKLRREIRVRHYSIRTEHAYIIVGTGPLGLTSPADRIEP